MTDDRWKRRIGGGDIPKLLGLSSYGNAADVFERVVNGMDDPWNPKMERGAAVEPELRAYGQTMLGLELVERETDYHRHPTLEFAHAQIDDIAIYQGARVCVDYKSQSRFAKGWGPAGSDQVPASIHAQLAWEMLCADLDLGLLFVGFGDDAPPPVIFVVANVIPYEVQRDPQLESLCIQTAREFWERHVLTGVPPDMKPIGKKKQPRKQHIEGVAK